MYSADYLFIDTVCPSPYETSMLKLKGMGGSESSLIKIAEGLGSFGLQVAVFEHNLSMPVQGEFVTYINKEFLDNFTEANVVVHQRRIYKPALESFKDSVHVLWCHDIVTDEIESNYDLIKKHRVKIICVSKWQAKLFKKKLKGLDISHIYNPIHDALYKYADVPIKYDPLKLVWLSSPHKDLEYALTVLDKIRIKSGKDFVLHCFNPGYMQVKGINHPYVIWHGSMPNHYMLSEASSALCLFMPMNKWVETFCIVAAEANCIQLPVAGYSGRDAIDETAQSGKYLVKTEEELVNMVINWSNNGRPKVSGNTAFKLSYVLKDWLMLAK